MLFFWINPFSFWGAAMRFHRLACFGPAIGTLTSAFAIKRTMLQRGYRQCSFTSFYYIPPVDREFFIRHLAFFNEMGKMLWPFPAGFYCLVVQKYQHCSPSLLLDVVEARLLMQDKSTLQAVNKSTHRSLLGF